MIRNVLINISFNGPFMTFLVLLTSYLLIENYDLVWAPLHSTLDLRNLSDISENQFQLINEFKKVTPHQASLLKKEQELQEFFLFYYQEIYHYYYQNYHK